jgi:integrase/recombinase XerD
LKVSDIDSQRMILHVREAKGGVPRDIGLSAALVERLRVYYRWRKPKDWLFPSQQHPDRPLRDASIRHMCRKAGRRAGIQHLVHPHLFRHYAPSQTMPHVDARAPIQARLNRVEAA